MAALPFSSRLLFSIFRPNVHSFSNNLLFSTKRNYSNFLTLSNSSLFNLPPNSSYQLNKPSHQNGSSFISFPTKFRSISSRPVEPPSPFPDPNSRNELYLGSNITKILYRRYQGSSSLVGGLLFLELTCNWNGEFTFFSTLLSVAIPYHMYWGFSSIISDYIPKYYQLLVKSLLLLFCVALAGLGVSFSIDGDGYGAVFKYMFMDLSDIELD